MKLTLGFAAAVLVCLLHAPSAEAADEAFLR